MMNIRISDLLAEMTKHRLCTDDGETPNMAHYELSYLCFVASRVFHRIHGDDPEVTFDKLDFQVQLVRMLNPLCTINYDHDGEKYIDFDGLTYGFDNIIDPKDLLKFTNIGFAHMIGEVPEHLKIDEYRFNFRNRNVTSVHRYACRVGMLLEIQLNQGDLEFVFY